jgi:hypothetical protein
MNWEEAGPELVETDFQHLEQRTGRKVPGPVRWFLTSVFNGGVPVSELIVPVPGMPGGGATVVHGIYGIKHPLDYLDLEPMVSDFSDAWPLGYDPYGAPFLYMEFEPLVGQIHHVPFEEYRKQEPEKTYLVASDIHKFAEMLVAGPGGGSSR